MKKSLKEDAKSGSDKNNEKTPAKPRSKGKTPKQVMHRHISDEKDVITDEDFKNLDLSIDIDNDTTKEPLEIKKGHNRPKDEDKDPGIITPWEIIK